MKRIFFQVGVIKAAKNVAQTETLRNSFELLKLSLVKSDIIILSNVAYRRQ